MIELKNVSKQFGNGKYVVDKVNLILPRYGLVIINGPSGCGKTTLLNILSTLLDFEGDVSFDGKHYQTLSEEEKEKIRNKKIGFVFQDYKLFEFEKVKDNILLSINLSSVDKEHKKIKRVKDLLSLVGLADKENELVSNLSGGEKQRVSIARALANSPTLLLADEPTGNLDEKNTELIMELIKKISTSSLVIMVSHDENITKKYADRIIKMSDGRIYYDKYQNQSVHSEYLPILKLKYNDKRRNLPFKFLFSHTVNSIKRRKWRTMFVNLSTSFGLIGVGLASTLSEIVSSNLYRSYSSIIDSDKIVISNKTPNIKKDIVSSASYDEVNEIAKDNKGIKGIGVYYWGIDNYFPNDNYICLDTSGFKKPIGNFKASSVNEFAPLSSIRSEIYPKTVNSLQVNEVILSMPMLTISEICYQLQIDRTITSLSNYISHHGVDVLLNFSNDSWGYSVEIKLSLKGFILSSNSLIYHSDPFWNEVIFENCCQFPTSEYINEMSAHPWDLKKTYYLDFSSGRDEFLINNRFSIENYDLDFELLDKKYYPNLFADEHSNNCNRLAVVHRTNKDDIPSYVGDYCRQASKDVFEITYGSALGYSIYEQSLMMGFSKTTYLSSNKEYISSIIDDMSYIKYEDSFNVTLPKEIVEGHFSKSNLQGFVFEPHYNIVSGREPVNFQEILISLSLANRFNLSNPINQFIYLSFPTKENLLTNGFVNRDFETVALKVVGVTDSGKLAISHKEAWSILFFQTMLGISTFDLRINNLAIRITEGKEDLVIKRIERAFPNLVVNAPLKDVKQSVDKICGYIEIIMLVISISSVIIAALILIICNHLHFLEVKKDIGLVRCLGVKETESRKFVFAHAFTVTGISFILASAELLFVSVILSKTLASSLFIESTFVFNPLSLVYMFLVAFFISVISSLLSARKISKIKPLDCLH